MWLARVLVSVLTLWCPLLRAQPEVAANTGRRAALPVETWLQEGERRDFKMELTVRGPYFGYQQRYLVRVFVKVDLRRLQKTGVERDLHFVAKVADESGRWHPDESYGESRLLKPAGVNDLVLTAELFFQPGRYTVAAIVYDGVSGQRSVAFRGLKVPPVEDDPLPQLARDLPRIEFFPASRNDALPLGRGRALLPLRTQRRLLIDLVVDFGAFREEMSVRQQNWDASRMVQIGSLLAQMQLEKGCIRVTGLDVLRRQEIFWRAPGDEVDWWQTRKELLERSLHTVGVDDLRARLESAQYLRRQLERLWSEPDACAGQPPPDERIVILLSHGVLFPLRTQVDPAQVDRNCRCRFFYVRLEPNQDYLFDLVPKVLRPISPKVILSRSPEEFRKDLGALLKAIEEPAGR